jgi:hypothetical protein
MKEDMNVRFALQTIKELLVLYVILIKNTMTTIRNYNVLDVS